MAFFAFRGKSFCGIISRLEFEPLAIQRPLLSSMLCINIFLHVNTYKIFLLNGYYEERNMHISVT